MTRLLFVNDDSSVVAGLQPEDLSRICAPIFTAKEPGPGTGIGPSVVKRIVQQIGSHIDVTSEPGQGATFITVYLPYTPCAEGGKYQELRKMSNGEVPYTIRR